MMGTHMNRGGGGWIVLFAAHAPQKPAILVSLNLRQEYYCVNGSPLSIISVRRRAVGGASRGVH